MHTYTKIRRRFEIFLQAKHFQNYKNVFKIINFDAAFHNLNFDTSSSVKPIKKYMSQYLVGIHFKRQPSRSRFLAILQQFDLKYNRTINYKIVQVFYIIKQYNAMNKSPCSNKLLETAANFKSALLTFLPKSSFNAIQLTMSEQQNPPSFHEHNF